MRNMFLVLGLALLSVLVASAPVSADVTVSDLENELLCTCGCTMVLETCQCETAPQMRAKIATMIDEGQTKQEILDYFVAQYGEKILAAPTKKGFNLVAWILPFAALIGGGGALFFVLRTWVMKGKVPAEETVYQPYETEDGDEYRRRFEEEFERFRQEEDA